MRPGPSRPCLALAALAVVLATPACGGDDDADRSPAASIGDTATSSDGTGATGTDAIDTAGTDTDTDAGRFPDVLAAEPTFDEATDTWSFSVTMSSPYDTPERYADGWRVVGPDGTVFGIHTLAHDHASEQPFTRTQTGVEIPEDVTRVTIEGRDQANGFGGDTVTVALSAG
jgi:hypothetical protein